MKKNVVKLNESDFKKLIKNIISERAEIGAGDKPKKNKPSSMVSTNNTPVTGIQKMYAFHHRIGLIDSDNNSVNEMSYDDWKSFGPDDYKLFMDYVEKGNHSWDLSEKNWFDKYAEMGPITVFIKY